MPLDKLGLDSIEPSKSRDSYSHYFSYSNYVSSKVSHCFPSLLTSVSPFQTSATRINGFSLVTEHNILDYPAELMSKSIPPPTQSDKVVDANNGVGVISLKVCLLSGDAKHFSRFKEAYVVVMLYLYHNNYYVEANVHFDFNLLTKWFYENSGHLSLSILEPRKLHRFLSQVTHVCWNACKKNWHRLCYLGDTLVLVVVFHNPSPCLFLLKLPEYMIFYWVIQHKRSNNSLFVSQSLQSATMDDKQILPLSLKYKSGIFLGASTYVHGKFLVEHLNSKAPILFRHNDGV